MVVREIDRHRLGLGKTGLHCALETRINAPSPRLVPGAGARAPGAAGGMIPNQMRSFLRAGVVVVVTLALTVIAAGFGPVGPRLGRGPDGRRIRPEAACRPACRVLILALPAVSWADVKTARLPHLDALLEQSAIAGLATRSVRQRTSPGDGYAALGAGTRTVAAGMPGQNMEPDERYGDSTAAEVFERRNGIPLGDNIGALSISSIITANEALPYDAEAGTLGKTLTENGVGRAVVANADEDELEPVGDTYHREAALGIMDTTGRVPAGRVDDGLLQKDPDAPFGLRLDRDKVMRRVHHRRGTNGERNVVLVEASDLAARERVPRVRQPGAARRDAGRSRCTRPTSSSAGSSRRSIRSATWCMVVGPYHSSLRREVTVAALRGAGHRARLPEDGHHPADRLRADRRRGADRPAATSASSGPRRWRADRSRS